MVEEKSIHVNGCKVQYLEKPASGAKTVVVFIHGFPFSSAMWKAQLEALPDTVQGIAYDIRGFGASETDHHFFSIDLFARDLIALCDALSLEQPVLCGLSMGGYVALRAAELDKRWKGLILCDTNSSEDSRDARLARFASVRTVQHEGLEAFADGFLPKAFPATAIDESHPSVDFIRRLILQTDPDTVCAALLAMASRTATTDSLPALRVPAAVIRGEEDTFMSAEQAEALARALPAASVFTIPGSGHLPNVEHPDLFNETLLSWLYKQFNT
jgi:pimeloyl-ACP methyl ester carboxylesterase